MTVEKRTIDFIPFGTAIAEEQSNRRISQCTVGYSPSMNSFIRIYPLPVDYRLEQWSLYKIDVERNIKDTREESWEIQ